MSQRFASRYRVRAVIAAMALAMVFAAGSFSGARADDRDDVRILFTQQDAVQAFDLGTGKGFQIGTATGSINGTTFVDFQFVPSGPPSGDTLPINFVNKVTITDIDGDQLFFDNNGTGSFHFGIPGFPFQGSGGPLRGTYVLTGATGKYHNWKVGTTFTYKAVATNPPVPPGGLGNVYVEISFNDEHR